MNSKNIEHRTYLDTSDGMATYAKDHGAFFDKERRQWYVVGEIPLEFLNLVPKVARARASRVVAPVCPKCGFHTTLKPSKKNGSLFYGCSRFRIDGCNGSVDYESYLDAVGAAIPTPVVDVLYSPSSTDLASHAAGPRTAASIAPDLQVEIAEVAKLAVKVFGDIPKATRWLNTPMRSLQSRTPRDSLISIDACQEIKRLIQSSWD